MKLSFSCSVAILLTVAAVGCDDAAPTPSNVGIACTMDTDCDQGSNTGVCLTGYNQLGPDTFDAAIFAGGYCSRADACTDDGDCGMGAMCLDVAGTGVCVDACMDNTECRSGYTCAAAPNGTNTATFCQPEAPEPCADNAAWATAGTCVLTYEVADGDATFEIDETPLNAGDDTFMTGPGTIVLQVTNDGGSPGDGAAGVLCIDINQRFQNNLGIITYTHGYSASSSSTPLATGTVGTDLLTWDTCDYDATYGQSSTSWTPAMTATGPGCVPDYRSEGDVFCGAMRSLCTLGMLAEGHNPQMGQWTQPLNTLEFSNGFTNLTMGSMGAPMDAGSTTGVEIPNDSPSRTYLGFSATLVGMSCQ